MIHLTDLPAILLAFLFILVEGGYVSHRWLTVSQEYARVRRAHPAFAAMTLGAILAALAIHLGFGWEN
jgi:hypothetical protein